MLIVWRRDLTAIIRLLAWQGVALAAIPILRGVYDGDAALIGVGVAVLVLRAAVLPWLLARAVGAEPQSQPRGHPVGEHRHLAADHRRADAGRVRRHATRW